MANPFLSQLSSFKLDLSKFKPQTENAAPSIIDLGDSSPSASGSLQRRKRPKRDSTPDSQLPKSPEPALNAPIPTNEGLATSPPANTETTQGMIPLPETGKRPEEIPEESTHGTSAMDQAESRESPPAQEVPSSSFTFSYAGEGPLLNNRQECARLLDNLKDPNHPSLGAECSYSEEAAHYLLKAATFLNHLSKRVGNDAEPNQWEDEKKALLEEMAKVKAELAQARKEAASATARAKSEARKVQEATQRIRSLEGKLARKSSGRSSESVPSTGKKPPQGPPSAGLSSEKQAGRLDAIAECKGKFDRIRDFIEKTRFRNVLIQSFKQVKAKNDLIGILEANGVVIPSIIKGELLHQTRHASELLEACPEPVLQQSDLEPPSLFPVVNRPPSSSRRSASQRSLPIIPRSDDVKMNIPSGINEHGTNARMHLD